MKIFQEINRENVRSDFLAPEVVQEQVRNMIALGIAEFIKDKIEIKTEKSLLETKFRAEVFVLSEADVEQIGKLILSLESYATNYGQVDAIKEKAIKIREILFKESL